MMLKQFLVFTVSILFVLWVSPLVADDEHKHEVPEKLGTVHFPTSCNPEVQKQFERGLALLHSFAYEEAERAFTEIVTSDPQCGMAYWGIAMSRFHPLWAPPSPEDTNKALDVIGKAKSITTITDRERDYIRAIETFYKDSDKLDYLTRDKSYESAMEQLHLRYPEDLEAATFYALALNSVAQALPDRTLERQKKAAAILEKVREKRPDHPGVYHYIIHSCDYPKLASLALPAAHMYSKIAPSAPHALHMPSHIFTRLGLWQESIQSNLDSQVASQKYAAKYHPDAAYYEELHAMDYLMYAYLQLGRDEDAKGVVEQAQKIEKVQPLQFSAAYAFAAIPARYAIERNLWAEAAALKLHPEAFPWNRFPYAEANLRFAVALGAARSKNLTAAQEEIKRLESLRDSLSNTKDNYRWYDLVEIHRLAAAGWLAHEQGNQDQAETLLRNAADLEDRTDKHPVTPGSIIPARELLADFLLETNKPAEALKEFEASLTQAPNRFHGLAGAARTAKLAGNSKKAAEYYSRLESLCGTDCNRPEFRDLKTFLAKK